MFPGSPDFLLSGGSGGLNVSPSSRAESRLDNSTLNFGNSAAGLSGDQALIALGVVIIGITVAGVVISKVVK